MERHVLSSDHIHPIAREKIAHNHRDVLEEAMAAVEAHEWVVFGMAQNPHVKRARKYLKEAGKAFHYIEHGSYLKDWRKRNVLKMWTGWPTFPMVFHQGTLIGGASNLAKYLEEG